MKKICVFQKKAVTLHPLLKKLFRAGSSSARLECLLWEQEVVSSNLAYPTKRSVKTTHLFFMKYKAIFIDIDDTLLDYIPCCREAFEFALPEYPEYFDIFFEISGRLFSEAKHGKYSIAEVMELYPKEFIAAIGYPESAVDPFKHAFRAAWGTTHTLVPGTLETLEALQRKGYRLFAASNSFGHLQRSRLEHAGILRFFEDTYISMDIGYDKPDVRFYEEALRRCGLQPHEVLMVGDSMTTDILGAQKAGLATVYFNRRNEPLPVTGNPSPLTVITSLPQLLQYV